MRTIHFCDTQGNILRKKEFYGILHRVWTATYRCIAIQHQDEFQVLSSLWQHHEGEDGDAFLSPNDIELLLQDIEHLKPLLKEIEPGRITAEKTDLQEIETFFDNLASVCQKAKTKNLSLKFVAD